MCRAEGAGVILAGLQPGFDAVFVDGVVAAQWVAALAVHLVLANQAEFPGLAAVAPPCRSVHGRRWSLHWTMGRWPADGSWCCLALFQQ